MIDEFEEIQKPESSHYRMGRIHRFTNWIAWQVLIWGSIFYCYQSHPTIAAFLAILVIGASF